MNVFSACKSAARNIVFALSLAAAVMVVALGFAAAAPSTAHAIEADLYWQRSYEGHFTSVSELLKAAEREPNTGVIISLTDDWYTMDECLVVPYDHEWTINLNGHMINRGKAGSFGKPWWGEDGCEVICVEKDSELVINGASSYADCEREHRGSLSDVKSNGAAFWKYDGTGDAVIKGGLITGGAGNGSSGGGIFVADTSKLTLNNVTVAGNIADTSSGVDVDAGGHGGGICLLEDAEATLNSSQVIYNHAEANGGGVGMNEGKYLTLKGGSRIAYNIAAGKGGGVWSYFEFDAVFALDENSTIEGNYALGSGGGVCIDNTGNYLFKSNDHTGVVKNNCADKNGGGVFTTDDSSYSDIYDIDIEGNTAKKDGGGLYIECTNLERRGGLYGITAKGNNAGRDGGGIYAEDGVYIKESVVTGNKASEDGGGAFVNNGGTVFEGCTINDNACNTSGKNYEGGGIFVPYRYDIKLIGLTYVMGNTRNGGAKDDVFLSTISGSTGFAYITGGVDAGSCVGVRTGITGDRRIGKNIKNNKASSFFIDNAGYYVSYGTDEGGDMWQRHRTLQFLLQINGAGSTRYEYGTAITANGTSTDPDKIFKCWSTDKTTGLLPVGNYITSENAKNPLLSFTMPQRDVNLVAIYRERIKYVELGVSAPVAGQELPTTGSIGERDTKEALLNVTDLGTVSLTWYELKDDGSKVPAAGVAKPGTSYVLSASVPESIEKSICFSKDVTADCAYVRTGNSASPSAEASTDAATGTLNMTSQAFKTEGEASAEDETQKVTIELENAGLQLGGSGAASNLTAMAADEGAVDELAMGVFDTVEVSCDAGDNSYVTVTAPVREGYNFCNWENVPDGAEADDEKGTVTLKKASLDKNVKLKAVYAPVVTEVDLGVDAPVAGQKLVKKATCVKLACSDGSSFDLLDAVNGGEPVDVSWTPNTSGKAACNAAYAAVVDLADGEGVVDADKVVSTNATVKANGVELPIGSAAAFSVQDGRLVLTTAFPMTMKKATANKNAAAAVTGTTLKVKAAKSGVTKKKASTKVKAPASVAGTKAKFKLLSCSKLVKVNTKTGKVILKVGAKKGKTYRAKLRVSYGKYSKGVKVKFVVK